MHLCIYPCIYLLIYLSIYPTIYLSICLSTYLSVYLSICLSVCLSVCLFVGLSLSLYPSTNLICRLAYLIVFKCFSFASRINQPLNLLCFCVSIYPTTFVSTNLLVYLSTRPSSPSIRLLSCLNSGIPKSARHARKWNARPCKGLRCHHASKRST